MSVFQRALNRRRNRPELHLITPDLDGALTRFWQTELYELVLANPDAFARIVKRQRKALGWSQQKVADVCEFSRHPIQAIEQADGQPERLTVSRIMDALALTVDDLRAEIAAIYDEQEAA
jgi:ribosome-binding protein aMBF1 (putative translation factor)